MYYVFLAALTTTECCQRTMPISFSPTSVQFKGEINDALPRKRHQKRHLDFCTAYLLSRGSGVRVSPGAPLSPSLSSSYRPLFVALALDASHCHDFVTHRVPRVFFGSLVRGALEPDEPDPADRSVSSPGCCDAWRAARPHREPPNSVECRTRAAGCRSENTKRPLS